MFLPTAGVSRRIGEPFGKFFAGDDGPDTGNTRRFGGIYVDNIGMPQQTSFYLGVQQSGKSQIIGVLRLPGHLIQGVDPVFRLAHR